MKKYLTLFLFILPAFLLAQNPAKKKLDHADFDVWKTISQPRISNDGQWAVYSLTVERGDPVFYIKNIDSGQEHVFERGTNGKITADNQHVLFTIKVHADTIRAMKRRKVKKKKLPNDTLAIFDLNNQSLTRISNVKSYSIPEEWAGWAVYEVTPPMPEKKDSTEKESKKQPEDFMVIKHLKSDFEQKIPNGKSHTFAKDAGQILISSESKDSTFEQGVYLFKTTNQELSPLLQSKGKFKSLSLSDNGEQAAFLADLDTSDAVIRPFDLYYWKSDQKSAEKKETIKNMQLPSDWILSEHGRLRFSDNGNRLYFATRPQPMIKDSTLLDEEIVEVEVWSWEDPRLYTQQKVELKSDQKESFDAVWNITDNQFIQLGDLKVKEMNFSPDRNARYAVGTAREPYLKSMSWDGYPLYSDVYRIDLKTGNKKQFGTKVKGNPNVSPDGQYFYWFNVVDTSWQTYSVATDKVATITDNKKVPFFRELHDQPSLPGSYGVMGWTKNDEKVLIYDRYDIWVLDPSGKSAPQRLTQGRENQLRYRYIRLDPDEKFIDIKKELMFSVFDEKTKESGYAQFKFGEKRYYKIVKEPFRYSTRPQKAKNANRYLYTKESFQLFPDLLVSDGTFKNPKKISDANPQQTDYSWGSIELYEWTSSDGEAIQGLLVKPENFDPSKKYPMIVNFYERSSDGLYRHRAPYPGRSTINYSFYVSRGYIIFNPDVPYTVGYPGESAEKSVLSGTQALINEGFIDKDRIGVQGHSWGGYQIAHLITRSNLFRCAESGAPVVNMFSAYGGIRWGSGLSRMFQYENTQSRIGGTIWDYPVRYMENSPIFYMDKVETPVLILHNDKDGAVPWYQGIEFFVALRRLGKPAWLLNYNDEPHWPVKRQNRLDFNVRMQQFFDYYLMDQPMPSWMERGVPAVEKGINSGLELKD